MSSTAPQRPLILLGEEPNGAVDLIGKLNNGEKITGTPLVVELDSSDLTITNISVNADVFFVNDREAAAGEVVFFHAIDFVVDSSPYKLKITIQTDSSPSQKRILCVEFPVEDC